MAPLRTLSYPLRRTLIANTPNKSPIITSITLHHANSIPLSANPATSSANFSTSPSHRAASHDDHYDPPGGWLFGVPPGEKYQKEGWENIWVYGFWGACAFLVVGYAFTPDTSIQTWALEEARRRLEAEGILPDPDAVGEDGKKD